MAMLASSPCRLLAHNGVHKVYAARPARPVRAARTRLVTQAFFGTKAGTFYDFNVKDIDGKEVKLSKYQGKVCLVVNLASQCGFTPQYAELQALHKKFSSKGLAVLGFPCNQFGAQEPGSNTSIKQFARSNYGYYTPSNMEGMGVQFDLFSKVDVNGSSADPLFDWLKSQKGGFLNSDIKWNFGKFLVDREGKVVARYGSMSTPAAIEEEITKLL